MVFYGKSTHAHARAHTHALAPPAHLQQLPAAGGGRPAEQQQQAGAGLLRRARGREACGA